MQVFLSLSSSFSFSFPSPLSFSHSFNLYILHSLSLYHSSLCQHISFLLLLYPALSFYPLFASTFNIEKQTCNMSMFKLSYLSLSLSLSLFQCVSHSLYHLSSSLFIPLSSSVFFFLSLVLALPFSTTLPMLFAHLPTHDKPTRHALKGTECQLQNSNLNYFLGPSGEPC